MIRGAFQACTLGYAISQRHVRQGYMSEILKPTVDYVFEAAGLHRIMANYMPRNLASEKVLKKLGFEREGYAKAYLKIANQWEDHILTAKILS